MSTMITRVSDRHKDTAVSEISMRALQLTFVLIVLVRLGDIISEIAHIRAHRAGAPLACISPVPPPCISAAPPLHLPCSSCVAPRLPNIAGYSSLLGSCAAAALDCPARRGGAAPAAAAFRGLLLLVPRRTLFAPHSFDDGGRPPPPSHRVNLCLPHRSMLEILVTVLLLLVPNVPLLAEIILGTGMHLFRSPPYLHRHPPPISPLHLHRLRPQSRRSRDYISEIISPRLYLPSISTGCAPIEDITARYFGNLLPDGDAHCFDATATVGVITFLMWQVGGGAWKLLGVITFLIWQVGGGAWVLLGGPLMRRLLRF